MVKTCFSMIVLTIMVLCIIGCSRLGSNSVISNDNLDDCFANNCMDSNRLLWGMWNLNFDLTNLTATIEPIRNAEAHFNITSLIPSPAIEVNTYNPVTGVVDVDCTISNPYTLAGYDVRLIIFTDNIGHKLLNADDWTSLYDRPGGLPINPFKAYASNEPLRIFAGQTQHTENLKIFLPGGNTAVYFAIDASWPGNCEEPYEITDFNQGTLYDAIGETTEISVIVKSWANDVDSVHLYCPAITGVTLIPFAKVGAEKWGRDLANNTGSSAGEHVGYIMAKTSKSIGLALYDAVTIIVTPSSTGWARTWGSTGTDAGCEVFIDSSGNLYLTGEFEGMVDFDPGPELHTQTSNGSSDAFLCFFNASGDFQWVETWGGSGSEKSYSVQLDSSGNIYVGGAFAGTVDFDPSENICLRTSQGDHDTFISKFNSEHVFQWVKTWGGTGRDWGIGLALHEGTNSLYSIGNFSNTVDFNPDPGLVENRTSSGHDDICISKFDLNGTFQWVRAWGSAFNDEMAVGGEVDEFGNIYISGGFGDATIDFDPGPGYDLHTSEGWNDCFLSKFNPNGDFLWARTWGGDKYDKAQGCVVDKYNDVYLTGMFSLTVDFDPGPGTDNHTSVLWYDIFLTKFDSSGNHLWAHTWGGYGAWDRGMRVEAGSSDYVYVTGYFNGPVDFDPGSGIDEYYPQGGDDMFLSKFSSNGIYQWARVWGGSGDDRGVDVTECDSGNIHISGLFQNAIDFNPGPGEDYHTSNGGFDVFLLKVKSDGYW